MLDSTDLALKVATNVLSYYEKFFNIKYPLPKAGKPKQNDHLLIPGLL